MRIDRRELARLIAELKPGQQTRISRFLMRDIEPIASLYDQWSSADSIMENIVGSAYEFRYWEDLMSGDTVFERLRKPLDDNLRTYVSPDRRHLFTKRPDGFYESDNHHAS